MVNTDRVVLVNDVNAVDAKGVRSHAWSVDVELGQTCSSRPCCNHGRDRDTGEALKGVASKINLMDTAVAIASGSSGIAVLYGPRNFSAFFVSFTQTHNIQQPTLTGFPLPLIQTFLYLVFPSCFPLFVLPL
jgi:hypothetical protein